MTYFVPRCDRCGGGAASRGRPAPVQPSPSPPLSTSVPTAVVDQRMSYDITPSGQHGGGGGVCYELLMATVTYQGGHVLSSLSSRY